MCHLASVQAALAALLTDRVIASPLDTLAASPACEALGEAGTLHALSLIEESEEARRDPVGFLSDQARFYQPPRLLAGRTSSASAGARVP